MRQPPNHQLLFSHPFLVESLLRGFVPAAWIRDLDFETLENIGGGYAVGDLGSRQDDFLWRIRGRDGWVYFYLLREISSPSEHLLAARILSHLGFLYQDLIRQLPAIDPLPPVLPIVLYYGHARWRSPTDVVQRAPRVASRREDLCPRVSYLLLDEGTFQVQALTAPRSPVGRVFRQEPGAVTRGRQSGSRSGKISS